MDSAQENKPWRPNGSDIAWKQVQIATSQPTGRKAILKYVDSFKRDKEARRPSLAAQKNTPTTIWGKVY